MCPWDWSPQLCIVIGCGFCVVSASYKKKFPWCGVKTTLSVGVRTTVWIDLGDYTIIFKGMIGSITLLRHFDYSRSVSFPRVLGRLAKRMREKLLNSFHCILCTNVKFGYILAPQKHEIKLEFDFCGCIRRWTRNSKCNQLFWNWNDGIFSATRHFNHKTIANNSAVWWEGSNLWGHRDFCLQMVFTWWSSLSRCHLIFPQLCFVLAYPREVPSYSLTTSKVAYFKRKYAEEEDLHQGYHGCFPKVRIYFSPNTPPLPYPQMSFCFSVRRVMALFAP